LSFAWTPGGNITFISPAITKDAPLHNKIQFIKKSGKKAAAIVQDLLTLARRGITINEICDINGIICDYLDSVEFQIIKDETP
jgi:hypothetical protein